MNAIRSVDQRVKSGFVQVAPTIERKTGSLSVRKICIEIELFCENLHKVITQVRKNNGSPEDIIQVLLKLQSSEYSYHQYLQEKIKWEEKHSAESKENNL